MVHLQRILTAAIMLLLWPSLKMLELWGRWAERQADRTR